MTLWDTVTQASAEFATKESLESEWIDFKHMLLNLSKNGATTAIFESCSAYNAAYIRDKLKEESNNFSIICVPTYRGYYEVSVSWDKGILL